jgi:uncharacterized protein (DUF1330 family)
MVWAASQIPAKRAPDTHSNQAVTRDPHALMLMTRAVLARNMPIHFIHSGAETMSAYILASLRITDPMVFEVYRSRVPAVIVAHGGRYLVRGGSVEVLEGDALGNRLVIVEFPDMSRLKAFYQCPEYQTLLEIRNRSAISTLLAIEGV